MLVEKYAIFSHQEVTSQFTNNKQYWDHLAEIGGNDVTNTRCIQTNTTVLPHYVLDHYSLYKHLLSEEQIQYAKKLQHSN